MKKNLYQIFISFFKIGTILLGGGYVILPLLQSEFVEKRGWLTHDELIEYYSISTSLPGVIAINTAVLTGNKLMGISGAITATCAIIMPAFLAIILLASILKEIVDKPPIQSIFWGIGIAVITLLYLAIKEMWKKSVNDKFSYAIYVICFLAALFFKIPPAIIIIGAIICGILYTMGEKV